MVYTVMVHGPISAEETSLPRYDQITANSAI